MLVSDIGWTQMVGLLVSVDKAEDVPPHQLSHVVKDALDSQWQRLK